MIDMSRSIKEKTEYVLQYNPQTRNSDKLLVEIFWKTWDRAHISENDAGDWVHLSKIIFMTSPDSITRCRRKFQEDGLYPATDPIVIERRKKERKIRATINQPNFDQHLPD